MDRRVEQIDRHLACHSRLVVEAPPNASLYLREVLLRLTKPLNQASLLARMRKANRSARLIGRASESTATSASASAAGDRRMIVRPMRLVGMCAWGMARGAGAARARGDGMGRAEAKRGKVRSMRMKLKTVVRRNEDLANMLVDLVWCVVW